MSQRAVHGILLLDKPLGMSSHAAVKAVKTLYRARKVGHTGSLDPLATGLLPICLGEATKIAGRLLGSCKAYEAECLLGVSTSTDDAEGEVTARHPLPDWDTIDLQDILERFVGDIEQIPPRYSALKRDGVRLYVLARRGEDVQPAPRQVRIHALECLGRDGPRLRLRVECGAGTYIRALARDLGAALGCGAHLSALRRLWVEPFRAPIMCRLEQLQEAGPPPRRDRLLLPLEAGLGPIPALHLNAADSEAMSHGNPVTLVAPFEGPCRVYADNGRLLALAQRDAGGQVTVLRGFNLPVPLPLCP